MELKDSFPASDGYWMPGEFEPHQGCILIWPERPGSWIYGAKEAREAFAEVIRAIAQSEPVYLAVSENGLESAAKMIFREDSLTETGTDRTAYDPEQKTWKLRADVQTDAWRRRVTLFFAETDDAWARDVAPTFVVGPMGVRAVNWEFNAWGGTVDGLYASWEKDNRFAALFANRFGFDWYNAAPFVLEGGSVHSDGEGTLMVTESCLLSSGRNPRLSKAQIETMLLRYLGAKKVLWLPRGIWQDETNEHVDNVCAFLKPGEVVLAWTDNTDDPQYPLSQETFSYLEQETDAKGRKLVIHRIPIPDYPVCLTKQEVDGYRFEEGEDERREGERLAASYVNFYFSNEAVVMPVFGGENEESDRRAVRLMQEWNPDRTVIPVPARAILVGGGNIHCITQQIPRKNSCIRDKIRKRRKA